MDLLKNSSSWLVSLIIGSLLSSCSYQCNGTWIQQKQFDNQWKSAQKRTMNQKKESTNKPFNKNKYAFALK